MSPLVQRSAGPPVTGVAVANDDVDQVLAATRPAIGVVEAGPAPAPGDQRPDDGTRWHDPTVSLVPGAPHSRLSVPTTRYRSRRPLPADLVPDDASDVLNLGRCRLFEHGVGQVGQADEFDAVEVTGRRVDVMREREVDESDGAR